MRLTSNTEASSRRSKRLPRNGRLNRSILWQIRREAWCSNGRWFLQQARKAWCTSRGKGQDSGGACTTHMRSEWHSNPILLSANTWIVWDRRDEVDEEHWRTSVCVMNSQSLCHRCWRKEKTGKSLSKMSKPIKLVACIHDVGCAHPGFAPYLAQICYPKVRCVHPSKWPFWLRASVPFRSLSQRSFFQWLLPFPSAILYCVSA